ncbi:MAG TPA: hypothetical protein VGG45_16200 [Terracidiphilus sp.]|jgi:hypothetical protein
MTAPSGPPTAFDSLLISGVPTLGTAGLPLTNGNYWFVNSVSGSDGNTGASNNPFATTVQALAKAATGDVVVWQEGHAETISTAGGVTIATAGVTFVGLGIGATRPTFTFSATAATWIITGASTSISNIVGKPSIDQVVAPFNVRAADCTLNIEWQDAAANKEALRAILTTAAADRLTVNLVYRGFTAGTHVVNAVRLVGCDGGNINVDFYGILTTAVVEFFTTACTNILVSGYFYVSGTTNFSKNVVDAATGSTWYVNGYDGAAGQAFDGGSGNPVAGSDVSTVIANQAIAEQVGTTTAAVISNALTLFNVAGAPVQLLALFSVCQTANDTTASTLQYQSTGTLGATTQTISGASATLASAAAGTSVVLQGTALSTAPVINANGAGLAETTNIIVPAGTIKAVVGVGSTTGTWIHYIRYRPLAKGAVVTAAF